MATVFSNNVIEIAVNYTKAGKPCVNVWHMFHDSEAFGPDAEAIVEDFRNNWQDHILTIQTNDVQLLGFDWRSMDPASGVLGTVAPDPSKNLVGTQAVASAPPNVALLVKKVTSDRQRGQRDGRMFLAGIEEGAIDNAGVLSGSWVAGVQVVVDAFYDGISDSGLDWAGDAYPVVLATTPASRAPGTASVTVASRRVTSLVVDPVVSTQRDRLR